MEYPLFKTNFSIPDLRGYHFFVAIITLSICGCGAKYRADIEFRDGTVHTYSLVSVRDSSIVVLEPYERTDRYITFSHSIIIRDSMIKRINLPIRQDFMRTVPLMLLGSAVGITFGRCSCDDYIYKAVLGLVIGYNVNTISLFVESLMHDWRYLWIADDRKKLRDAAVFQLEPDIMKYLR